MTGSDRPLLRRTDHVLRPDATRVVTADLLPAEESHLDGTSRLAALLDRVLALSSEDVERALGRVLASFDGRHRDLAADLDARFVLAEPYLPDGVRVTGEGRRLIGAFLTQERAIEAAALFNPSMVAHPDQSGLAPGSIRFVMSVRGVGEGHLSCVEFRTGTVDRHDEVRFDSPDPYIARARPVAAHTSRAVPPSYRVAFDEGSRIDARVLLPGAAAESQGIEDLRLVRATSADGEPTYLGTYTAFDGRSIAPCLLRTDDFRTFELGGLTGSAARNKGMALFPRPVGGQHLALSRWDRENNALATSPDLLHWEDAGTLHDRRRPWEMIHTGNCGSPVETPAGWLVLTHGVGPMRTYSIGAMLLDLADPRHVLGYLDEPLLVPREDERDGYVPNVVYSCGGMLHGDTFVLPYGASDATVRVCLVDVPALLDLLTDGRRGG